LGDAGSPPFSFSRQAEDFAFSPPLDLSAHPYHPIGRKSPDNTNKLKFEKLQTQGIMRDYTCSEANDLEGGFRSALFLTPPTLEVFSTKS